MKKLFLELLFTGIFYFLLANTIYAQNKNEPLTVYYLERIPYFYTGENGQAQGLVINRIKLAFEKAGVAYRLEPLPAKRHMKYLKDNKNKFCTIGWYKNKERQKFAKYSEHIYQNKTRIALAMADNNKIESGHTIDDVFLNPNLVLLLKDGYSYGGFIDGKINEHNPVLEKVPCESIDMIRMLHGRRVDFFFTSEEEADVLISEAGFKKEDFQYVRFSNMPTGLKRYILYSQKVGDDLIEIVDEAIKQYIH